MNHRIGSIAFGFVVGVMVAVLAYQWITAPDKGAQRAEEERVVVVSRSVLGEKLGIGELEFVDPVAPQRKVGKVYIYPEGKDWAVSGYYRRQEVDRWHPYLMLLAEDHSLISLKLQDKNPQLLMRAGSDPLLEISP